MPFIVYCQTSGGEYLERAWRFIHARSANYWEITHPSCNFSSWMIPGTYNDR